VRAALTLAVAVARIERSEIREQRHSTKVLDFASLNPGYKCARPAEFGRAYALLAMLGGRPPDGIAVPNWP
jgi:hypothetical protein